MYPTQQLPYEELSMQPKHEPGTTPTGSFQEMLLTDAATGAVLHQCPEPECGRQFNRKYTLTEHMKTHTGEKPHVCPMRTCNKRFSTSGNLARHKRLHGFIQPIECPVEGCVCTFPSDNKLEKHMKFHYGGPVQVCDVLGCGKTFSTMGNLNRHMKNQHPDVYNPHAATSTPTERRKSRSALKRSPTSAEDWSHSSGNGDHLDDEDDDEEDDDDDDEELAGEEEDDDKPDMILDALSSLLEDTDIARRSSERLSTHSSDPEAASPPQNLFDDIIRFHVEDLGGFK